MTERTRLRRLPEQGSHRPEDLHAVLDAGFVCHLGLVVEGAPMVVPTSYGRAGDTLYLHGSVASRSLRAAREPVPVCVTVTLVDGVVLARSVFNHSVNYRCAMVYGRPDVLTDVGDKLVGLETISEHVAPGQWRLRTCALGQGAGRHHRPAAGPRRGVGEGERGTARRRRGPRW